MAWENPLYKLSQNNINFVSDQLKVIVDTLFGGDSSENIPAENLTIVYTPVYGICYGNCNGPTIGMALQGYYKYDNNLGTLYLEKTDIQFDDTVSTDIQQPYILGQNYTWDEFSTARGYSFNIESVPNNSMSSGFTVSGWLYRCYYCFNSWRQATDYLPYNDIQYPLSYTKYSTLFPSSNSMALHLWASESPVCIIPTTSEPTGVPSVTYNNTTFYYNYPSGGDGPLTILPTSGFSYDDLVHVLNTTILPYVKIQAPQAVEPTITFPAYNTPIPSGVYPIEQINSYNYTLEIPEVSQYLDATAVADGAITIGSACTWLYNAYETFGLSPALGFVLVATMIIKGLRGD